MIKHAIALFHFQNNMLRQRKDRWSLLFLIVRIKILNFILGHFRNQSKSSWSFRVNLEISQGYSR